MASESILLVDDNPTNLQMLFQLLEKGVGGKLLVAKNGETALNIAQKTKPDLILLDIMMPGIDGFEVARQVLAEPDRPTIILTSTRDAQDYGRRIEESGAAGFVTKARLTAVALREILG